MRVTPGNIVRALRPRSLTDTFTLITAALAAACVSRVVTNHDQRQLHRVRQPLPAPAWTTDSMASTVVAPGIVHRSYVMHRAPWSVQVLDVDLGACWTLRTAKAGNQAIGRATTTVLVSSLAGAGAIGGVNADFFAFTPPGVPVGLTVSGGTMVTGANPLRPTFLMTATYQPWIGFAATVADLAFANGVHRRLPWNVLARDTVRAGEAIIDARWGDSTASLVAPHGVAIIPASKANSTAQQLNMPVAVRTEPIAANAPLQVPVGGWLWVAHGPKATVPATVDAATVTTRLVLSPRPINVDSVTGSVTAFPREAVGGQPVLVRDSAVAPEIETTGNAAFRGVNPRTALGIAANGRRVFLVVIDGRQPGYSVGTSLRETAEIMRALGAREAINLDGGGSSAMVLRNADAKGYHLANKPSDKEGERPVGDALVVVPGCRAEPPAR